jgi:hypothetical protein
VLTHLFLPELGDTWQTEIVGSHIRSRELKCGDGAAETRAFFTYQRDILCQNIRTLPLVIETQYEIAMAFLFTTFPAATSAVE